MGKSAKFEQSASIIGSNKIRHPWVMWGNNEKLRNITYN